MKNKIIFSLAFLSAAASWGGCLVANGSFDEAPAGKPTGWTNSGKGTQWVEHEGVGGTAAISVTHSDRESTSWYSAPVTLKPNSCYQFSFQMKSIGHCSGGTVTCGPSFANIDVGLPDEEWNTQQNIFVTPMNNGKEISTHFHLGQWHLTGTALFDNFSVTPVTPLYQRKGNITLGAGEKIKGNEYHFQHEFWGTSRNHARPLAGHQNITYNSTRWCFQPNATVLYHHTIPDRTWKKANCALTCGYYVGGSVAIEYSLDQKTWAPLGAINKTTSINLPLPEKCAGAKEIWIRLRGVEDSTNLQIMNYGFSGEFIGEPLTLTGSTRYMATIKEDPKLPVNIHNIGDAIPGGRNIVAMRVQNKTGDALQFTARVRFSAAGKKSVESAVPVSLPGPGAFQIRVPYQAPSVGQWEMEIETGTNALASTTVNIPSLYDDSYGELLPVSHPKLNLWRASSGWKIPQFRDLPTRYAKSLSVRTARNEAETVQLVLAPNEKLQNVRVTASNLRCGKATLPATDIEIRRVGYVPIEQPTDFVGCRGMWPDPLLPQGNNFAIPAGRQQPYWIRVKAGRDLPAGIYRGTISVTADDLSVRVPLFVEIFDFSLPDQLTCETAFGFRAGNIWRYHNLKEKRDRDEMTARYLQMLADSHISPYNPVPGTRFTVEWEGLPPWTGNGHLDTTNKYQGKSSYKITDASTKRNGSWTYKSQIPLGKDGFKIRFRYKTEPQQSAPVFSLNHYTTNNEWISGKNVDWSFPATATWTLVERIYPAKSFPKGAQSIRPAFYAAGWQDNGEKTGTLWIDEFTITDVATGKVLVQEMCEHFDATTANPVFDWTAWDAAMEKAFSTYHFNTFMLPVEGLGGGTFQERYEPTFLGFSESQPEYHILMGKYLGGIEKHLKEKGWIEKAYVYWFDEPEEKDYAFVMKGFNTLKRHAPGLRRLLTEQPEPALLGGPNLWVPLTPSLHVEGEKTCRDAGDQFWWYVCCGPKAPFVTEFIDHPGCEMRLWLWQTWGENVTGILMWESLYWTSPTAYPNHPQNPYLDAQSWVSGGPGMEPGTKSAWGNGDGRFIYPPRRAANADSKTPVLEGPVPTFRLEMLREGLEDYEYFVILRNLLKEKKSKISEDAHKRYSELLRVPKEIYTSLTAFAIDPAFMEAHRELLARAIVALQKVQ